MPRNALRPDAGHVFSALCPLRQLAHQPDFRTAARLWSRVSARVIVVAMCNDFGNRIPYSDYLAAFSETRIPVRWPSAAPNLQPRDDIWPTEPAPIVRRLEDGSFEFSVLRWGFPPAKPKGPPIINFRSECTAPGSLDKRLAYAARLKGWSCQAARASSGLRWPFFSISHSAL